MTKPDASRITQLEIQLVHLQRHVEQLDGVITDLGRLTDRQSRKITSLENQLRDWREKSQEAGLDSDEEKPPHY